VEIKEETYRLVQAYEKISNRYKRVKKRPWRDLEEYIEKIVNIVSLPKEGYLCDIGGGNGRNLQLFQEENWYMVLVDLSLELLKGVVDLPQKKRALLNSDMCSLPLRSECSDLVLYIATLHHLHSYESTRTAFTEMKRIMKKGSYGIISVWRRWKKDTAKFMIRDLILFPIKKLKRKGWRHGDFFLPWKNEKGEVIAKRYYHLFTKREVKKLINKVGLKIVDITVLGGKGGADNIFVLMQRKN